MRRSARGHKGITRVARCLSDGDVDAATTALRHTLVSTRIEQSPGDIDDRLQLAGVLSSYVFAAQQYLDDTANEVVLPSEQEAHGNRRLDVERQLAPAGRYAVEWLEEYYGADGEGLFARLDRGEIIQAGAITPPGAADTIIVSLYAKAMTEQEQAAPLFRRLLAVPAETDAVRNLQANVRQMIPDAERSFADATTDTAQPKKSNWFSPGDVGDSIGSIVGDVLGNILG